MGIQLSSQPYYSQDTLGTGIPEVNIGLELVYPSFSPLSYHFLTDALPATNYPILILIMVNYA